VKHIRTVYLATKLRFLSFTPESKKHFDQTEPSTQVFFCRIPSIAQSNKDIVPSVLKSTVLLYLFNVCDFGRLKLWGRAKFKSQSTYGEYAKCELAYFPSLYRQSNSAWWEKKFELPMYRKFTLHTVYCLCNFIHVRGIWWAGSLIFIMKAIRSADNGCSGILAYKIRPPTPPPQPFTPLRLQNLRGARLIKLVSQVGRVFRAC